MTEQRKSKMHTIIEGVLSTALIGCFIFMWNLNADNAVFKNDIENIKEAQIKDESNRETANAVLKDWSSVTSTQESHARQLKNIWGKFDEAQKREILGMERLSRVEIRQEICCE